MAGKEIYTSYAAFNKALDQVKKSRLVFTTCAGSGLGILRSQDFDTVIIDEASQQTEPASLVPLVKKCTKAILVGDHVQLGAVVQRHAVLLDFNVSLFERLYKQDSSQSHGIAKVMLDTQYRMHESICRFSSKVFYEDRLQTNVPNHTRPLHPSKFPWPAPLKPNDTENRMVFVECSTKENALRKSKVNEGQVSLCHRICCLLRTTAEEIEEKEIYALIDEIMFTLPELTQKVFNHRWRDDLSTEETAQLLNIDEKAVYNRMHIAINVIRDKVSSMLNEGDNMNKIKTINALVIWYSLTK